MKRYVSLVLVFIMLGSLFTTVSATESAELKLHKLGLMSSASEADLDGYVTRDVLVTMVLKAMGFTQNDANLAAGNSHFNDVEGWAKGWAELAYAQGIIDGTSNGHFNPRGFSSEKQFVEVLLRGLEYDQDTTWENINTYALEAGLIDKGETLSDYNFTKRKAAERIYRALFATMKIKEVRLIDYLLEKGVVSADEAEIMGLIDGVFSLVDHSQYNMKETVLTFSKAINIETLSAETFRVYDGSELIKYDDNVLNGITAGKYALQSMDDNTLRVLFGTPFAEADKITYEMNGLESVSGDVFDKELEFQMKDVLDPEVLEVEFIGQNILEITCSEPVQFKTGYKTYNNILVAGKAIDATATMNYDKTVIRLELNTKQTVGEKYIAIKGLIDFDGNVSTTYSSTVKVAADTVRPTIISAKVLDRVTLQVTFSELLDQSKGYFKFDDNTYHMSNIDIYKNTATVKLKEPFDSNNPEHIVPVKVEDFAGNLMATATKEVEVLEDTRLPSVSLKYYDERNILLIFSEKMQLVDQFHIAVTNSDDELVGISQINSTESDSGVYKLMLVDKMVSGKAYYLEIKGAKDQSVTPNMMGETKLSVNLNDRTKPRVSAVNIIDSGLVRISFNENMNGSQLVNLDNYRIYKYLTGDVYSLSELVNTKTQVGLEGRYVDLSIPGYSSVDQLMILKVEDQSGNMLTDYGKYIAVTEREDFGPEDVSVTLIDNQHVRLTLKNHNFANMNPKDFAFTNGSGSPSFIYAHSAKINAENTSIADLTLNSPLLDDGTYNNQSYALYMSNESITDNNFGSLLTISESRAIAIDEKIRPTVTVKGEDETIKITFSEMMKAAGNKEVLSELRLYDSAGKAVELKIGVNLFYVGGEDFSYRSFTELFIDGLDEKESYRVYVGQRLITDLNGNASLGYNKKNVSVD